MTSPTARISGCSSASERSSPDSNGWPLRVTATPVAARNVALSASRVSTPTAAGAWAGSRTSLLGSLPIRVSPGRSQERPQTVSQPSSAFRSASRCRRQRSRSFLVALAVARRRHGGGAQAGREDPQQDQGCRVTVHEGSPLCRGETSGRVGRPAPGNGTRQSEAPSEPAPGRGSDGASFSRGLPTRSNYIRDRRGCPLCGPCRRPVVRG